MVEWTERELMRRMDIGIEVRKDLTKEYKDKIPRDILELLIKHQQQLSMIFNHDQNKIFTTLEKIDQRLAKLEKKVIKYPLKR